MTQFTPKDLFGGAIKASLPSTYQDVSYVSRPLLYFCRLTRRNLADEHLSEIRQVPDNQEVYLDANGFSSIVVDILERVEAATDDAAVDFHVKDVVGEELDVKVWRRENVQFAKLPCVPFPSYITTNTSC